MRSSVAIGFICVLVGCSGTKTTSSSSGSTGFAAGGVGATGGTGGSNASGGTGSGTTGGIGGTNGGGGAAYTEFCTSYNSALCSYVTSCGFLDPAVSCSSELASPTCDAGAFLVYDPAQGSACLASLPTGAAADSCTLAGFISFYFEADGGTPCLSPLRPGVAEGGACDSDSECIPRPDAGYLACVRSSAGTCSGTCSATIPNGQQCGEAPCADGYCNYDVQPEVCTAYLSLGANCDNDYDGCNPASAVCSGPPDGGGFVELADGGFRFNEYCLPLAPLGSACDYGGCEAGSYCGALDGGFEGLTCLPESGEGRPCSSSLEGLRCQTELVCFQEICRPPEGPVGSLCGYSDGSEVYCSEGYCSNPDAGVGSCQALPGAGAACVSDNDLGGCQSGLTCLQGVCTTSEVTTGATCGSDGNGSVDCQDGYCSNPDGGIGICEATLAHGQACTSSEECAFPDLCASGVCGLPPTAGQPCGLVGGSFFDEGCAAGDYCDGTQCALMPSLGESCSSASTGGTCQAGYCDPTGHCSAYLSAGSPCIPSALQCSSETSQTDLPDGGDLITDYECQPTYPDGGSPVCALSCN